MAREIKQWITINGVHVPIFEGESKDEAVSRYIDKKAEKEGKSRGQVKNEMNSKKSPSDKKDALKKESDEVFKKQLEKRIDKDEKTKQEQIAKNEYNKEMLRVSKSLKEGYDAATPNKQVADAYINGDNKDKYQVSSTKNPTGEYVIKHKTLDSVDVKEAINKAADEHIEKIWNGGAANKEMYDAADKIAEKYGLDNKKVQEAAMKVMNEKYAKSVETRQPSKKDDDWFETYKKVVSKGSGEAVDKAKAEAIREAYEKQVSNKGTTYEVMEKDGKYVVVGGNNNGRDDPGSWHSKREDRLDRGYKPLPDSDYEKWRKDNDVSRTGSGKAVDSERTSKKASNSYQEGTYKVTENKDKSEFIVRDGNGRIIGRVETSKEATRLINQHKEAKLRVKEINSQIVRLHEEVRKYRAEARNTDNNHIRQNNLSDAQHKLKELFEKLKKWEKFLE